MKLKNQLPGVNAIVVGGAIFSDEMPVWFGYFKDMSWLTVASDDPRFMGPASSSIVWGDFIHGRGWTFGHANSQAKSRYPLCLTAEIVHDLKVAAVIHSYFPTLIKNARTRKEQLDPTTVKGRIDELARFFSAVIIKAKKDLGITVTRLQDIPYSLFKDAVAEHPGRGAHLKRALKLISAPAVQKNLYGPLKWQTVDLEKGNIRWPDTVDGEGIPPLPEIYFLFIMEYCIETIGNFKTALEMPIICKEYRQLGEAEQADLRGCKSSLLAFLEEAPNGDDRDAFALRFPFKASIMEEFVADAQCACIMLILLLTGMRTSETHYVHADCLEPLHGYWFLKSKVVKQKKKDAPICEGWLATDIVRDAYDILNFFCGITKNTCLISSPFSRFVEKAGGYSPQTLSSKLGRWLKKIDVDEMFSDWQFSIHQCRETLVAQLANEQVGLPFISMQLKHFSSRFREMPNEVTAGYGKYREQLWTSVTNRVPHAREDALNDLYAEGARFAGGGGAAHKERVDAFFAGMGLFGEDRIEYIRELARRGAKLQPTSIGHCGKNFAMPTKEEAPPCYGDFECDPDCGSSVITERGGKVLRARHAHAVTKRDNETDPKQKVIWIGIAERLDGHLRKLGTGEHHGR